MEGGVGGESDVERAALPVAVGGEEQGGSVGAAASAVAVPWLQDAPRRSRRPSFTSHRQRQQHPGQHLLRLAPDSLANWKMSDLRT